MHCMVLWCTTIEEEMHAKLCILRIMYCNMLAEQGDGNSSPLLCKHVHANNIRGIFIFINVILFLNFQGGFSLLVIKPVQIL